LKGCKVYTIGYERRKVDEFVDELVRRGIERVADVRGNPVSRKKGFSSKSLEKILRERGIEYRLFSELGTPKRLRYKLKSGVLSFSEFALMYREYLKEREDKLRELEEYVSLNRSAVMCFERDWRKCHRSVIAEILERDGFKVVHI